MSCDCGQQKDRYKGAGGNEEGQGLFDSNSQLKRMALMLMGIKQGDTVKVTGKGEEEDTAAASVEAFFTADL